MNLKNNKGITLISLIITVILLSILAYTTVSIGGNLSATAKFENVQTDLLLIKSKCDILANEAAIGEIGENELYGEIQSDGTYKGWYKLSQGELNTIGLQKAKEKDGYYVNYGSDGKVDVAFEKGVEFEGETYYKLSSILNVTN